MDARGRSHRRGRSRRRLVGGLTLLELLAVLTVLAVLSAAAMMRARPESLGNLSAKTDARQLGYDLIQARRRAIANGDNHLVQFTTAGSKVTGYTVCRRSGAVVAVDEYRAFGKNVTVTVTGGTPEFNFQGEGLASYTITLAGPNRSWQVSVVQATGAVRVAAL